MLNSRTLGRASNAELAAEIMASADRFNAVPPTKEGTSLGNKEVRLAGRIMEELDRRVDGLVIYTELLAHQNPTVRLWVGLHGLDRFTDQAVPVLERLAAIPTGKVSMIADLRLRGWRGDFK